MFDAKSFRRYFIVGLLGFIVLATLVLSGVNWLEAAIVSLFAGWGLRDVGALVVTLLGLTIMAVMMWTSRKDIANLWRAIMARLEEKGFKIGGDKPGQGEVEYAVTLLLVAIIVIVVLTILGPHIGPFMAWCAHLMRMWFGPR